MKASTYPLLVLLITTLPGCASHTALPPATSKDPAVIGQTSAGPVYAFSYEENGQHVACETLVKLDKQQQMVPQQNWGMKCTATPIRPPKPAVKSTLLDLTPGKYLEGPPR